MGSRTVRLDDEAEDALDEVRRATGMSISQALKTGLVALREKLREEKKPTPWEVYERLDLGPGGYATAPARQAKEAVREAVRRKHRR